MSSLSFALALIASYALLGAGIKLVDHAVDDPNHTGFHKAHLWLVITGLVILVNFWVFFDVYTAVLAIAVTLGLIASQKVDNAYFLVLAITILPLSLFRLLSIAVFLLALPTLITIFVASILDEALHAKGTQIQNATLRWLVLHRPVLKITVLILPFFGFLTFVHTLGFWCFDIAYDALSYYFGAKSVLRSETSST